MKKSLLIIFCILTVAFSVSAANKHQWPGDRFKHSRQLHSLNKTEAHKLCKTRYYIINDTVKGRIDTISITKFSYDEKGRIIKSIDYTISGIGAPYTNETDNLYDANGLLICNFTISPYNLDSQLWDSHGNPTMDLTYANMGGGAWDLNYADIFTNYYDSDNHLTGITVYIYDDLSEKLKLADSMAMIYTNDTFDHGFYYQWNNGWNVLYRFTGSLYNNDFRLPVKVYKQNYTGSGWKDFYSEEATYDASGRQLTDITKKDADSGLVNDTRNTYVYDRQGNLTLWTEDYWENGDWQIDAGWKQSYIYDADGDATIDSLVYYYPDSAKFLDQGWYVYEYDLSSLAQKSNNNEKTISVYPNPVKNTLNIATDESINQITICDATGKNIMEYRPSASDKVYAMDISALKQGFYIVSISTGKGIVVRKLIKE